MVKPRSKQKGQQEKEQKAHKAQDDAIERLADKLADKPYGTEPVEYSSAPSPDEILERVTITMPSSTREKLEDLARARRRAKEPNKSVSAIIREALDSYL